MANALYAKGRQGFLGEGIDWDTDTIKAILVDAADYTLVIGTHDNLDDIAAGARVSTSPAFTSKTITDGVADAADITFTAVTGDPCELLVIYKDTGTESTSRLIAAIDTVSGGGAFTVTPNGGDIIIQWDNGTNRIFKL